MAASGGENKDDDAIHLRLEGPKKSRWVASCVVALTYLLYYLLL